MIVVWRVTERCNLSCAFCAFDRTLATPRRDAELRSVERFGRLLGDYRRTTGERVLVSWLGGEPLLWEPVYEVSRWLRRSFDVDISATTNGTTLHLERVRAGLLDCFSELTVSVDGLPQFHDRIRGWRGGWQRLRSAVQALAQARAGAGSPLRLRANVVLMRDNLPELADLCAALAEWGLDEITFNQLGGRDRPSFFAAHAMRPQDARTLSLLLPALRAALAARGVRLCGNAQYLERIAASANGRRIAVVDCAPGERFLFIDERGRVAPCSFTTAELGFPLEDIRTLDDLRRLPVRFADARRRLPAPACGDCPSTQVFAKFAV
jgi:MoaA/NifB/PqqE/SkfB family radical SAM enzyme